MQKPRSWAWVHFTQYTPSRREDGTIQEDGGGSGNNKRQQKARCNYCGHMLTKDPKRMCQHLANSCKDVPLEVRGDAAGRLANHRRDTVGNSNPTTQDYSSANGGNAELGRFSTARRRRDRDAPIPNSSSDDEAGPGASGGISRSRDQARRGENRGGGGANDEEMKNEDDFGSGPIDFDDDPFTVSSSDEEDSDSDIVDEEEGGDDDDLTG